MIRLSSRAVLATTLAAAMTFPAVGVAQSARTDQAFQWSGRLSTGAWLRIRNLNGPITVGPASGDRVEVTATRRWRRGDPTVVRFDTMRFGARDESLVICALWGERTRCEPDRYRTEGRDRDPRLRDNDVSVEFRVLLPRGVRLGVNTVNGDVTVLGAGSEVAATTVNGDVAITTSAGPVNANTVNGSITARLGRVSADGDMSFTTVNGSITAELPGDLGADVELTTVNGSLSTDWEMMVSGRLSPRNIRAHIGQPGGPRIRLVTVNGSVELRKAPNR
jgi:hypothetical protein